MSFEDGQVLADMALEQGHGEMGGVTASGEHTRKPVQLPNGTVGLQARAVVHGSHGHRKGSTWAGLCYAALRGGHDFHKLELQGLGAEMSESPAVPALDQGNGSGHSHAAGSGKGK